MAYVCFDACFVSHFPRVGHVVVSTSDGQNILFKLAKTTSHTNFQNKEQILLSTQKPFICWIDLALALYHTFLYTIKVWERFARVGKAMQIEWEILGMRVQLTFAFIVNGRGLQCQCHRGINCPVIDLLPAHWVHPRRAADPEWHVAGKPESPSCTCHCNSPSMAHRLRPSLHSKRVSLPNLAGWLGVLLSHRILFGFFLFTLLYFCCFFYFLFFLHTTSWRNVSKRPPREK